MNFLLMSPLGTLIPARSARPKSYYKIPCQSPEIGLIYDDIQGIYNPEIDISDVKERDELRPRAAQVCSLKTGKYTLKNASVYRNLKDIYI